MVYIYPNTLQVSPANPYNTDQIAVSCYIGLDFFDNTGWPDPTRTYEYLLMRPASPTGTWVGAQIVATYDCWDVNCWEGMAGQEVSQIPNNPNANYGYLITFPAFNAPSPGSYELMAVDYGDYGKSTYDPTRTATFNLTVSQNPNSTPITTSSGNTTSSSSSTYLLFRRYHLPVDQEPVLPVHHNRGGRAGISHNFETIWRRRKNGYRATGTVTMTLVSSLGTQFLSGVEPADVQLNGTFVMQAGEIYQAEVQCIGTRYYDIIHVATGCTEQRPDKC